MVPMMFLQAGVEEKKTNHSLRAAGVTQLYEASVDEKIIQARSGHRRLESLRMYERISQDQEQAVSNILGSLKRVNYCSAMEMLCRVTPTSSGHCPPSASGQPATVPTLVVHPTFTTS